jgi:hypothetical protein
MKGRKFGNGLFGLFWRLRPVSFMRFAIGASGVLRAFSGITLPVPFGLASF